MSKDDIIVNLIGVFLIVGGLTLVVLFAGWMPALGIYLLICGNNLTETK